MQEITSSTGVVVFQLVTMDGWEGLQHTHTHTHTHTLRERIVKWEMRNRGAEQMEEERMEVVVPFGVWFVFVGRHCFFAAIRMDVRWNGV